MYNYFNININVNSAKTIGLLVSKVNTQGQTQKEKLLLYLLPYILLHMYYIYIMYIYKTISTSPLAYNQLSQNDGTSSQRGELNTQGQRQPQ